MKVGGNEMKIVFVAMVASFLFSLSPDLTYSESHQLAPHQDPDKVTREANTWITYYKDWVYYWGRNEAEKDTQVTNAFFREKMDGSGKVMLSDWNERVLHSSFDIENDSIYYVGEDYEEGKWKYSLKRMELDGGNKQVVLEPFTFGGFEVEGNIVYYIDYDLKNCPNDLEDYRPGVLKRTNLKTKKTESLKECIYPRLWPISAKGTYVDDEFYPKDSTKPLKAKLKNVWKEIGHKSPVFLDISRDEFFSDRGDLYYIIWSRQTLTKYFVKQNENTRKVTLIKELAKYGVYMRLVNIHRGYAYFEANIEKTPFRREIQRIPLTGGKLEKIADIPYQTGFEIINGHIFFIKDYKIISRTPLPR
jgi:hypothetical protein